MSVKSTVTSLNQPKRLLPLPGLWLNLAGPVIGIIVGLLIGAGLIKLAGADIGQAYLAMLRGAFGGTRQLTETVLKATPLLLVGLGLTVAFRARVWNIGGEGQYYLGALGGSFVALTFPQWPRPFLLTAMLLVGAAGGALWAMLAGVIKIKRGVNVIISTLMLNYVAILLVQYMVRGPLQDPNGFLPESAQFAPAAQLMTFFNSRIHLGVFLAIALVPVIYGLLWATPLGFQLRAIGSRESVARYAGVKVEKMILLALAWSGALSGLAGLIEVSTLYTRLKPDISGGYGFNGILVALLGRMHPVGVILAALFFAALSVGAQSMEVITGLPHALAEAIQAVIVLSVLATDALIRRSTD